MIRQVRIIPEGDGKTLLALLREAGCRLSADCGGRGRCGRCRVRFLSGAPEASEADRAVLAEELLRDGWRLACRAVPVGEAVVEVDDSPEEAIHAAADFRGTQDVLSVSEETGTEKSRLFLHDRKSVENVIAVDVGTTTIAAAKLPSDPPDVLPGEEGTDEAEKAACVNSQRSFGADVISRMAASNAGEGGRLQEVLLRDLEGLAGQLGISPEAFADGEKTEVVISGNTTMQHLLQGLSCRTLGAAPYTPVDISLHRWRNMTFLPGVSTFVGADIVSGIVACGMDRREEITLLIDLGTNGEMVLGNRDKRLCASTAAGPAFEGGNISCGMAGVPGAVSAVEIVSGRPVVKTLGGMPPKGLCGTGVLETVYELLKEEIIDETGLLDDAYFEGGYPLAEGVVFTAKDVREVQLAKAAVRAGIEVLLEVYGIGYEDVEKVWLAGGFGERLNAAKAVGIGLIPEEFLGRIVPVGNSSLAGAILAAGGKVPPERFAAAAAGTEEAELSSNPLFNELYVEHMLFPETED